jgi:plasmid maintenance system antidote protein VapI
MTREEIVGKIQQQALSAVLDMIRERRNELITTRDTLFRETSIKLEQYGVAIGEHDELLKKLESQFTAIERTF